MRTSSLSLFLLLVSTPALAYVWFDNPAAGVLHIDRPAGDITSADVYVDGIRMHKCGGGYTDYPIGATLDLATPYTFTVGGGEWCGATVGFGSVVEITNGSWTVEYEEPYTHVEIDENPEQVSAALTPFTVTSGTFSGLAPRLYVTLQ